MPRIYNSPDPENEQMRPTKMDNASDNKLNRGPAKRKTNGGEIYDHPGNKPSK